MYHTDVFSLSGYRSVLAATRRRSSQATGPLVVAIWQLTTNKPYQYMNVIVKTKLSYFVNTGLNQLINRETTMESISNATILTLAVTISLSAVNFFFGIHGRLKRFTNESISVYKKISSLEDDNDELSDAKKVAKQKLKEQVYFEITKIKDISYASLMLEILKNNPALETKKETSVRTVIDCLDKEVIHLSPPVIKTILTLNHTRFRKKTEQRDTSSIYLYHSSHHFFSGFFLFGRNERAHPFSFSFRMYFNIHAGLIYINLNILPCTG
jgi:hypothetical protein